MNSKMGKLILLAMLLSSFMQPAVADAITNAQVKSSQVTKKPTKKLAANNKKKRIVRKTKAIPSPVVQTNNPINNSKSFVAHIGSRVITFVHKTIATLSYNAYKLGGQRFDTARGVYVLDCSDYVDNILKAVYPDAYLDLIHTSKVVKPTSETYYEFFSELAHSAKNSWRSIEDVDNLLPGDVLVFRIKKDKQSPTVGHVMVVMDKPVRESNSYLVRVADSAPIGHSEDTRSPHTSGIGVGTLQLKVNPKTGHPSAYAWRTGSRWKENVKIAMARPLDFDSEV